MLIDAVLRFEQECSERAERIEVALDRREVLIIDNRRVLHSRGECTVRQEGDRLASREVNLAFLV
jgi:alpha-ketoglutarate-dependent taurine dioxygenase